jgi:hypothetical protein
LGNAGLNAKRVGAALALLLVVSCGGSSAQPQNGRVIREPVPLPPEATLRTEPATTSPATSQPAATEPAATVAPPLPPHSTAPPATTVPGCLLRTLAPTASPEDVAAAFVIVHGTVTAAAEQSVRLDCLRSRLSDPLTSPSLPPSFTPEQIATHWRLLPTTAPAVAVDQDSPQSVNRVVLTATLRAQVEQDGADPVPTVSQLLLELVNQRGRWLVATMSHRTVTS